VSGELDKTTGVIGFQVVNYETLAYKILLEKNEMDILSIFKTYVRNLKLEEERAIEL
jgi:hypothetical protein